MHSKGGIMNITGTHAPQTAIPTQDQLLYINYHKLKEIAEQYGKHTQHIIIVGDFNAKIVKRLPEEREGILDNMSLILKTSRSMNYQNRNLKIENCSFHFAWTKTM